MAAITCVNARCRKRAMIEIGGGSRKCLECGQEFHPLRLRESVARSLGNQAKADEAAARLAHENSIERHLWVPKTYSLPG